MKEVKYSPGNFDFTKAKAKGFIEDTRKKLPGFEDEKSQRIRKSAKFSKKGKRK